MRSNPSRIPCILVVGIVCVIAHYLPALAFIQERTPNGSLKVRWNLAAAQPNVSGGHVLYAINKRGSDDVTFSSVVTEVEGAFGSWNMVNTSVIAFTRVVDPSPGTAPAGTRANRNDRVNVVLWDEDPDNSSMIPPMTFSTTIRQIDAASGDILDADVVLNASQFRWAAKPDPSYTTLTGPVDIRSTITHAIGLFIGLNIVPTQGSVMQEVDYPGDTAGRILTGDELAAALDLYPPTPNPAVTSISGQVTQSGQPVFGAYAVAYQSGRPLVGAITDTTGAYSIRRVAPGSYTVRVLTVKRQLDSPYFSTLENSFLSQAYSGLSTDPGTPVVAVAGSDTPGINFAVASATTADPWEPDDTNPDAKDITPNGPRQIHHTFPVGDLDIVKFNAIAGHIYVVETSNLGSGASDCDTSITVKTSGGAVVQSNNDRDVKQKSRTSRVVFTASAGQYFVEVLQANAITTAGSGTAYDITVEDLGTSVGAPLVSSVAPPSGSESGGYQVAVNGANLVRGAAVTFGANLATQVDVLNSTQLFATVPPGAPGAVTVTVTNSDGTPSLPLAGGFTYIADVTAGFIETTLDALGTLPGNSKASSWVDYDGDGDLDLDFSVDIANQLYRNEGDGTFTDVSGSSGIVDGIFNPNSGAWGDFNNDGCPDFYLVNPPTASNILFKNNCNGTFTNVTAQAGVAGRPAASGGRDAAWADFDNDGFLDLFVVDDDATHTNQLFKNNKNGQFTDVTAGSGISNLGTTVNANWGDFDRDGWPDLFLVRSGTQTDFLYHNNTNGTLTDVTAAAGITNTAQGIDAVWGDFSGDGYLDLYVVGTTGINRLFQNTGSGTFTDISSASGTGDTLGSSRAVAVTDFDNDGLLDIFVAQAFDGRLDSQIDFLFHNEGGSPPTFLDYTFFAGVNDPFDGLSVCFGDYTGGGTADLFVGNAGAGNDVLAENQANQNSWLVVRLVGSLSNRLGVGARVSVTADLDGNVATPDVTQTREVIGGSKGQNAIEAAFGLGRTAVERREVANLSVFWPTSGKMQSFNHIAVDQVITVFEGTASLSVTSVSPSSGPAFTGTTVVVSGENFAADATVAFGGVLASIVNRMGSTSITVTTPGLGAGPVDVTVTNPSRPVGDPLREGVLPNGYLYVGDVQQSLHVFDQANTTLIWGTVPGQSSYDAIRGNLASLSEGGGQVNLGSVVCLENDSPDTTTAPGSVDQGVPALGQGFFYLVRFSGSYGTSSAGSVRVPASGDCP